MTAVLVRLAAAVPWAGADTVAIFRGSPGLGSVSLASTLIWTNCPAGVVAVSLTAVGGLLPGGVTVTLTVAGELVVVPSVIV